MEPCRDIVDAEQASEWTVALNPASPCSGATPIRPSMGLIGDRRSIREHGVRACDVHGFHQEFGNPATKRPVTRKGENVALRLGGGPWK